MSKPALHKVAILGASGYTGLKMVDLLLRHPHVEIVAATSRSNIGKPISDIVPRFQGMAGADLEFIDADMGQVIASGAQTAFLALPHGKAHNYALKLLDAGLKVIDISADFRLRDPAIYEEFYDHPHPAPELLSDAVYGMPELYSHKLADAQVIASPGCYPTSIILPLVPLLQKGLIDHSSIVVNSMSGVSGAGKKADLALLFVECNESVRAYGLPKHRHLSEIEQELTFAAGEKVAITFTPHLIPVNSGIHSTTTATLTGTPDQVSAALEEAYTDKTFVRLLPDGQLPDTKNVTGTNFVDIAFRVDERTGRLIILSAEDNLIKGASGQAIQAFNIANGYPESSGLL